MGEDLNNIDNLFEKAVGDHVELPTEQVWGTLETALQKRKVAVVTKKYKQWKWTAAALFLFSIAVVTYSIRISWKYKTDNKETASGTSAQVNNNKSSPNAPKQGHAAKPKMFTTKSGSENVEKEDIASENQHLITEEKKIKEPVNANSAITAEKNEEINITKLEKETRYRGSTSPRLSNAARNMVTHKHKLFKEDRISVKRERAGAKMTDEADDRDIEKSINPNYNVINNTLIADLSQKDLSIEQLASLEVSGARTSLAIAPLNLLVKQNNLSRLLQANAAVTNTSTAKSIRLSPKRAHPGKMVAGVFYSRNSVSTVLEANRPDYREDNYLQIKSHEKNRISSVFGFSLERFIGRNLTIGSGISFSNFTTDIANKPLVARKDNNGKINYRISTSSGYAYYFVKARPQPAAADSLKTLSSKSIVKYVTIPISLRYHVYLGSFEFVPTLSLNANYKKTGEITTIQSIEHTYTGDITGLKSHYFDGNAGIGFGYFLNKRIAVSLFPSAHLGLSKVIEGNPVIAKRNTYGIAGSLQIRF